MRTRAHSHARAREEDELMMISPFPFTIHIDNTHHSTSFLTYHARLSLSAAPRRSRSDTAVVSPSKRRVSKLIAKADYLEAKGHTVEAKACRTKVRARAGGQGGVPNSWEENSPQRQSRGQGQQQEQGQGRVGVNPAKGERPGGVPGGVGPTPG